MAANEDLRRALVALRGIQGDLVVPPGDDATHLDVSGDGISSAPTYAPSVFISWAHSHSSWTPEQTQDWESQVAEFAATLRSLGIDADIDLFHLDEAMDWTRFGPRRVQGSKLTLVVLSQAWAERWTGSNVPTEGAGAAAEAEADTLRGLFNRDQAEWQKRIVLVMLPEVRPEVVPPDLQRATRVSVDPSDPDTYENLLRILTEQPRYPKPPLGEVPAFGAASGYSSDHLQQLRSQLAENQKRQRQLAKASDVQPEQDQLAMIESALRGFIEAELKRDE